MASSSATIQTASGKRYLGQFCKHFAHKLPVEQAADNKTGEVTFGIGICKLQTDDTSLSLQIDALTMEDAANLQNVVERHLVRFAFREELALNWQITATLSR